MAAMVRALPGYGVIAKGLDALANLSQGPQMVSSGVD
jgi:hypothetical protein